MASGFPAAIVALTIGAIAGYIAFQQWRVSRAKLNLDLFEQRYALFEIFWAFTSARVGDLENVAEVTIRLRNSLPKFYFLFGEEIGDHVSAALTRAAHQDVSFTVSRSAHVNEATSKAMKEASEHSMWFYEESNTLRSRFARYLDFKDWK